MSLNDLNPNDRTMLEAMAKEKGITPEQLYADMGIIPKPILVEAPATDIIVELGPVAVEESHTIPDIVPITPITDIPPPPEYKEEVEAEDTTVKYDIWCIS